MAVKPPSSSGSERQDVAIVDAYERRLKGETTPGLSAQDEAEIEAYLALHDQVVSRLRTMLVEGRIPPGAKLNERELSEQLRVSRTPLREAIKLLAAEAHRRGESAAFSALFNRDPTSDFTLPFRAPAKVLRLHAGPVRGRRGAMNAS